MAEPVLSVVVPSVNGWGDLEGCLACLEQELGTATIEVLVPDRCGEELRSRVRDRYPWVRLLPASSGTTIPDLRALAFDEARGEAVAVLEDHVRVPRGWVATILAARARGDRVVGGAVRNGAVDRRVDVAAFLCEYSHLIPPIAAGPVSELTGNNTAYERRLLQRYHNVTHSGRWEDALHAAMLRDGIELVCQPDLVVEHKRHYTVVEYCSQRYLYARSFAGMRHPVTARGTRAIYGVLAFGLPVVLLVRLLRRLRGKSVPLTDVLSSLPLLALFVTAWGVGEVVGYWFGPGDALAKVC